MPTSAPVREFDFLRLLNGRFDEPRANKLFLSVICIVFGIAAPVLFAWALQKDAIPFDQWSPDQWTVAILIPGSMALGVWVFFYIGGEYEFAGDSVTLRRRGVIVGQMRFDDVKSVTYSEGHHGHKWYTLHDNRRKLIVMLFPELKAAVAKAGAELNQLKAEMQANQALQTTSVTPVDFGRVSEFDRSQRGV